MTPRYAAREDGNHKETRKGIRADGYYWRDTFRLGDGFVDGICVSKTRIPVAVELKMPGEELTDLEEKFRAEYPGPYEIAYGLDHLRQIMDKWDHVYYSQLQGW